MPSRKKRSSTSLGHSAQSSTSILRKLRQPPKTKLHHLKPETIETLHDTGIIGTRSGNLTVHGSDKTVRTAHVSLTEFGTPDIDEDDLPQGLEVGEACIESPFSVLDEVCVMEDVASADQEPVWGSIGD